MSLRRETLKLVDELIRKRILTEEDLIKINAIMLSRIEKLEEEAN